MTSVSRFHGLACVVALALAWSAPGGGCTDTSLAPSGNQNNSVNSNTNSNSNSGWNNNNGGPPPAGHCLVTQDGGDPAVLTLNAVHADGTIGLTVTQQVVGNHTPDWALEPLRDQVITRCGQHVYYVAHTSQEVGHAHVSPDGIITPGGTVSVSEINGVHCDESRGLLYAVSHSGWIEPEAPQPDTFGLDVFALQADGSLSSTDSQQLTTPDPAGPDPMMGYMVQKLSVVRQPVSGEIWVLITMMSIELLANGLYAYRLDLAPDGTATVLEGPTLLSQQDAVISFTMAANGSRLAMAGYSGGCFAWFDLQGGGLPPIDSEVVQCNDPWGNSHGVALPGTGDLFYLTSHVGLTAARFDPAGPQILSQQVPPQLPERVALTHSDTVVVTFGFEGELATYLTDPSGSLTLGVSTSQTVHHREGGVIVPCDL